MTLSFSAALVMMLAREFAEESALRKSFVLLELDDCFFRHLSEEAG